MCFVGKRERGVGSDIEEASLLLTVNCLEEREKERHEPSHEDDDDDEDKRKTAMITDWVQLGIRAMHCMHTR